MNILAYCDRRYAGATRRVAGKGATLYTTPPLDAATFPLDMLAGQDVFYLDLHGRQGSAWLYSREGIMALGAKALSKAAMSGAVVISLSCYLPETPFLRAFLDAGAVGVIAGNGSNWGSWPCLSAVQVLARQVIRGLADGLIVGEALEAAQWAIRCNVWYREFNTKGLVDALEFKLYR